MYITIPNRIVSNGEDVKFPLVNIYAESIENKLIPEELMIHTDNYFNKKYVEDELYECLYINLYDDNDNKIGKFEGLTGHSHSDNDNVIVMGWCSFSPEDSRDFKYIAGNTYIDDNIDRLNLYMMKDKRKNYLKNLIDNLVNE